ncbi:MAG: 23S rRNA (pseudouridine(1915)-N(3))-methyltransferase RlmH [Hyphomicrobiaceae bacterium]|nr:23S rRNA (pseudouridine(1915)-N(3))-methyltransferase RlmH [Hyphomicrobiaceae bacterium]MCC0024381.1 23S rRNA (pseudouridine(1915)-N(3))-methyltransferase RlmH [Hyphomicrobiaceae bacterium]
MQISLVAVGRLKSGPERELVARYLDRAIATGKPLALTGFSLKEISESRASSAGARKADEARQILAECADDAFVVALDERGKASSSEDFAQLVARERDNGRRQMTFLIGGADGLDENVRKRADLVLAFSPLTWPHQLVRILLCEQLYRTTTILSGHPYHRA